ncbi:MAG: hypothetical protein K2Y51_06320 [Gammaproteobacteria bacterium]|nr:hypothetical protein [Gammaproteobacteria bacterium]
MKLARRRWCMCWLGAVLVASLAAQAQELGSSPEFTRLAECNRIAGKTTGTKREALIAGCMERIEPGNETSTAAAKVKSKTKASAAAAAGAKAETKAAAGTLAAPAAAATGATAALPGQSVILGCANQVAKLTGDARAKALKACLADGQEARPQAKDVAAAAADTEQRRRANCNVLAHDKQGEARKAYIADCMAQAERRAVTRASAETAPAVGGDRTARCAAEARANPGDSIVTTMNACLARP